MCRIAGVISTKLSPEELLDKTRMMCQTLAHGGPDDEGIYHSKEFGLAFGHRRLAIIDLTASGHQPMADAEQNIVITFNGEIYNYPELKEELAGTGINFVSGSDTEVIIQAYLKWGTDAFAKLRGMFAFALHDKQKGHTCLVRDTSGIKPLYYHINNGQLSFASEVKALNKAGLATQPDSEWPIRFLAFGHIPEPFTTLKDVFSLPKGHYLIWDHGGNHHQIKPYQLTGTNTEPIDTAADAQNNISTGLNKAIKRQLLADAPIGVFLSGGIDSSLVTLLAYQYKKDELKTTSIFFNEQAYNERHFQDIVLKGTGASNQQHLVQQQDFEDSLPAIMTDMDMPTTDGINSWFISKYARQQGLKAVLSGLGGDELFGGYPSFKRVEYLKYLKLIPSLLLNFIAKVSVGPLKRVALLTHNHPLADYLFLRGLFVPADIAKILNVDESYVAKVLFATPLHLGNLTDTQTAAWFETNLYMQNQLLRDTDVMSMAHGLEVRVPFLDEDFIQTVNRIAPDILFDNSKPKNLLIESFGTLLPRQIWDRQKMGFSFPLQQWMLKHCQISDINFYKNKQARKVMGRFKDNKVHWSRAFALYQLQTRQLLAEQLPAKNILLLTLQTFSATGGIQKMSRTMAQAIQQIAAKRQWNFSLWSGYDHHDDLNNVYIPGKTFKGFNKKRWRFALNATTKGAKSDVIILSHINLALIGWAAKIFNPKCEVWVVAHGIEVWRPLKLFKKRILSTCDKIICVSNFTMQKMITMHGVNPAKCVVLNNALDPSIKLPATFVKPDYLLKRYNLSPKSKIVFTLTRLASTEQYKGYEQVIKAVSELRNDFPDMKYILSGKYDSAEDRRIRQLIKDHAVEEQVIVTGFINEAELEDHFLLADLFVLPSKKEGFGIVFIEALACGLPVICGNEDGSLDAIRNGELGKAINVNDINELKHAISDNLNVPLTAAHRLNLQRKCLEYFNAGDYKDALEKMLV
ncbi:asparagine synthase (glutamine-hydrolyzing) [Mucilaginibacter boryungensis]|uniref:asparagine synthase (glutamine-hydrolyzing) n=1 Tax=Mucilaginibacter boryungensis TaxID=768480 RepID=A0ABR9XG67_9SPHI|nr:asparagine synthase (glutamine-hydrolyzing) [Mucilaginibacter boryungensis]MBE9666013.1 asparagine synthase (glutamine-hydrolyzing) [Mucilaginibacter boryungensis]